MSLHPFSPSRCSLFAAPPRAGRPLTSGAIRREEDALGVRLPSALLSTACCSSEGGKLYRTAHSRGAFVADSGHWVVPTLLELPAIGGPVGIAAINRRERAVADDLPVGTVLLDRNAHHAILLDYRGVGPAGEPSVLLLDVAASVGEQLGSWPGITWDSAATAPHRVERTVAPDLQTFLDGLVYTAPHVEFVVAGPVAERLLLDAIRAAGGVVGEECDALGWIEATLDLGAGPAQTWFRENRYDSDWRHRSRPDRDIIVEAESVQTQVEQARLALQEMLCRTVEVIHQPT